LWREAQWTHKNGVQWDFFSPLWNFPSTQGSVSSRRVSVTFHVASYYTAAFNLYLIFFFRLEMSAAPRVYVRISDLSRSPSRSIVYELSGIRMRSFRDEKGERHPSCPTLGVGLRILALSERENRHTCCCRGRVVEGSARSDILEQVENSRVSECVTSVCVSLGSFAQRCWSMRAVGHCLQHSDTETVREKEREREPMSARYLRIGSPTRWRDVTRAIFGAPVSFLEVFAYRKFGRVRFLPLLRFGLRSINRPSGTGPSGSVKTEKKGILISWGFDYFCYNYNVLIASGFSRYASYYAPSVSF